MSRFQDILDIASITIDTLTEIGVEDCCFIGSVACRLYEQDEDRDPKDLDILCLTTYRGGAEAIKRQLCEENDNFYTLPARNREDHWRVLYWDTGSNDPGFERIKVDILVPGVMDLPNIAPNFLTKIQGIPCAPLHLLLFHKLQAWDERRRSSRPHFRAKIPGDIQDIVDLLHAANRCGLKLLKWRPYITDSFHEISCGRVQEFITKYPRYRQLWANLGMEL